MRFKLLRNNKVEQTFFHKPSALVEGALCLDSNATEKALHRQIMSKMPSRVSNEHLVALDKFSRDLTYRTLKSIQSCGGAKTLTESITLLTDKGFIRFKATVGLADEAVS